MRQNDLIDSISLDGKWQFSLGESGSWDEIQIPGSWEAQGFPKSIDGPARYHRTFTIPTDWEGRSIWLEFGALSYTCQVLCNDIEVGSHTGMWTPFTVDLTGTARPGQENVIELVVWKPGERYPMRSSLAGFLPDLATTFGGAWQNVKLCAGQSWMDEVFIRADYTSREVRLHALAQMSDNAFHPSHWLVEVYHAERRVAAQAWDIGSDVLLDVSVPLGQVIRWSPKRAILYTVQLSLMCGEEKIAQVNRKVGFRSLSAVGSQLTFNDKPMMARGILSWGWEPERIAPFYTREQARDEMRRVREMSFNLIKLCLFIPNTEFFDAADEEGMLLWVELPMWLPAVTDDLRRQAPMEYAEITRMLAHHPSIVLYSLGCELNRSVDPPFLEALDRAVRPFAGNVLVCDNSGSGESYGGLDVDMADFTDYHPYYDLHFFEPLLDHWRRDWQPPRPWIFGEFCDSDTFRDQNELIQANGGERPWWLTLDNPVSAWRSEARAAVEWEDRINKAQPGFSIPEMVQVSLGQSFVIRKYTLEVLRRRRGMGGYVITALRDTPISTSGIWDDLGRPKWSPKAFEQNNGEAVLALDVVRRRQWRHGGDRPDRIDPYTFWAGDWTSWALILCDSGAGFPAGSQVSWVLKGPEGNLIDSHDGIIEAPIQSCIPKQVCSIQLALPAATRSQELTLDASVQDGDRAAKNTWPIWVFPRMTPLPAGVAVNDPTGQLADFGDWLARAPAARTLNLTVKVLVSTVIDPAVWQDIRSGGRVLLLQQGDGPLPVRRCPFWREAVKLFAPHPVWDLFPQRGFTDLQFMGMASDMAFDTPRLLRVLPQQAVFQPILRRLDAREFHISDYLFEAKLGKGILIGCALRLQGGMGVQPAGWHRNVAGAGMLQSLLQYLTGNL